MEVWFYHLQRQSLDAALPLMLEKALARGWRAVVQGSSEERIAALDQHLWTYADDSFLAHGRREDGDGDLQPVYLTTGEENPNGAQLRIFIEGADPASALKAFAYERAAAMFDGNDEDELASARKKWKALKAQGFETSYWRQDDAGRWERSG